MIFCLKHVMATPREIVMERARYSSFNLFLYHSAYSLTGQAGKTGQAGQTDQTDQVSSIEAAN